MNVEPEVNLWIRLDELGKAYDEIDKCHDERIASYSVDDAYAAGLRRAMQLLRERVWAVQGKAAGR